MTGFKKIGDIENIFCTINEMGFRCCQLSCWDARLYTDDNAVIIKETAKKYDIEITAFWAGWSGPAVWDFYKGQKTLGLIPKRYRKKRVSELKKACDFAVMLGVTDIITHVGFLPENPNDKLFSEIVETLKDLCSYYKKNGGYFLFEAGQETPVTLLRTIEAIGTDNIGINFDTANLILYGKASSADALDVIGKYVRNTHCKDGFYPTSGDKLGEEAPLGEGKANFPEIIKKLNALGYKGPFIIEREINGEKQKKDIIKARDLLLTLLADNN